MFPSVIGAQQVNSVRVGHLGDNDRNVIFTQDLSTRTGVGDGFYEVRVGNTFAYDRFDTSNRQYLTLGLEKNVGRLAFGGYVGGSLLNSNNSRTAANVETYLALRPVWNNKNPYGLSVTFRTSPYDALGRFIRTEIDVNGVDVNGEVFVGNKLWLSTTLGVIDFSDGNRRSTVQINARNYTLSGLFVGAQGFVQSHRFDGLLEYAGLNGVDRGIGYWAPKDYMAFEGQVGYKFPWDSPKWSGQTFAAAGIQTIDSLKATATARLQTEVIRKISSKTSIGLWGTLSNNASVANNPQQYRWWTVGTTVRIGN
jgi:hypothetical protein